MVPVEKYYHRLTTEIVSLGSSNNVYGGTNQKASLDMSHLTQVKSLMVESESFFPKEPSPLMGHG